MKKVKIFFKKLSFIVKHLTRYLYVLNSSVNENVHCKITEKEKNI